jgi:hypothetical protein
MIMHDAGPAVCAASQLMSIGGDIKFLRLKQRGVEGLVCDGGIRDMHVVKDYGPLFFGYDKTSNLGTRVGTPYATNDVSTRPPHHSWLAGWLAGWVAGFMLCRAAFGRKFVVDRPCTVSD